MGFWAVIGLLLWPFYVSGGILVTISLYHFPGFLAFMVANVALAYWLNKARKHGRAEAFDDRLDDARMREARDFLWPEVEN